MDTKAKPHLFLWRWRKSFWSWRALCFVFVSRCAQSKWGKDVWSKMEEYQRSPLSLAGRKGVCLEEWEQQGERRKDLKGREPSLTSLWQRKFSLLFLCLNLYSYSPQSKASTNLNRHKCRLEFHFHVQIRRAINFHSLILGWHEKLLFFCPTFLLRNFLFARFAKNVRSMFSPLHVLTRK